MGINLKKSILFQALLGLLLIFLFFNSQQQLIAAQMSEPRTDGLILIQPTSPQSEASQVCYLSMIIKTGYADDPKDKAGLTDLTNELFYYLLKNGLAVDVNYYTGADFSVFNFIISQKNFAEFCSELDFMIRKDALLLYDLCNELVRYRINEPHPNYLIAMVNYHELIYGVSHAYLTVDHPNYRNLTINDVNSWFRLIYRPNNLIIAASSEMPVDFLLKPFGREIQKPVIFPNVTPAASVTSEKIMFAAIHDNLSTIVMGFPAPRLDENDCLTTIFIQKYLQKELWDQIREHSGLCYDIQVDYSYLNEPSAPTLTIICQTLPEDSDLVIRKIIQVFKKLASEGVPEPQKNQLLAREKKQLTTLGYAIQTKAFQAYFNRNWIGEINSFTDKLGQVSQEQVIKVISDRLQYLKISVAGPSEVSNILKEAHLETELLSKPIK
jgi:hypothetical protein